jgi:hypothetical protein
MLRQRAKVNSQLVLIGPETVFGADTALTTGQILNLAAESGFGTTQARKEVPVWKGKAYPHKSVLTQIMAGGKAPFQLEFLTAARLWRLMVGANGYARPGAAATTLHDFQIPTAVGSLADSCQLQESSYEATASHSRNRGVLVNQLDLNYGTDGGADFAGEFIGVGDELQTALVTGGNVVDEGFTPVNFFDGQLLVNGVSVLGMTSFQFNLNAGISRTNAGFQGGKAGSLVGSVFTPSGSLGLLTSTTGSNPEADFNFYNYAVQNQTIPIDAVWCNAPMASADLYCRLRLPGTKWTRGKWKPGGQGGLQITQPYRGEEVGNIAAEVFGTVRPSATSPVVITLGVNDKFALQIDGGATLATITLAAGSYTDVSAFVTAINAVGAYNAVCVADSWMGRLRITSKQVGGQGPTSSVKFDTAVANNCASTLGFTNALWIGYYVPFLLQFYNTKGTNY